MLKVRKIRPMFTALITTMDGIKVIEYVEG